MSNERASQEKQFKHIFGGRGCAFFQVNIFLEVKQQLSVLQLVTSQNKSIKDIY